MLSSGNNWNRICSPGKILWAFLPLLLLFATGLTRASTSLEPLDMNLIDEATLGKHLMFLEDPQGVLLLDDILTDEYQSRFEPVFVDTPYFGRTRSTYWFRLQVAPNKANNPRLIEIAYPHLKSITLYEMKDRRLLRTLQSGYENRDMEPYNCLRFCFLIKGNHGIHTLYFRISTDSPMFVPMVMRAPEKQLLNERINMAVVALFYGAFVVMGLFNLFLFFSTQDRSYLFYVMYIVTLFLWTSSHDGLLREVLLYRNDMLSSYRVHFLLTLVPILFGALFCQRFLRTAETMPLHHRVFSFLILLCLVDAALTLVSGRILLPDSVNLLTVTFSIAGVSASVQGLRQGLRTARFFLTAWVAVILGSVLWVLTLSGVLPFNSFTAFSVHIGGLLETILLSLALGDRINMLQAERIQLEQDAKHRLEDSNQKLEASNRFKDEFLSTVSHELRTPMNGIIGASELLEHTELNSEQYKYLSTINRSSHDMLGMIENILTYTQFEAGTATASNRPMKIRQLLDEMTAHYRGRAAIKQLEFRHHIDPSIPSDLAGDFDKVKLLLDQVLDNAIKFTDSGHIRFDVTVDEERKHKDTLWLKFVIRDTGCGVPESLQGEIFNSFKQGDGSMTRRKGGLGIGLALSKRIIDILDGRLTFKSSVLDGTTVILSLPFRPCAAQDEPAQGDLAESINCASVEILVVEDNYVNKLVLEGFLKKLGFSVQAVDNGKEAVALLEKREFDLVFMDCQMPVMDGFEATRQLRKLSNRNAGIPVVAVTANANPGDRERCLAAGMNDYLKKPFSQQLLVSTLNRWLQRQRNNSVQA